MVICPCCSARSRHTCTQGGPKNCTRNSRPQFCQILTDFQFFHCKILQQICSKVLTKDFTIPCICCHTTLWNINVKKQAINDKLQDIVAAYQGVVGLSITTSRKVYLPVEFLKKPSDYLAKLQARRLSRALCALGHHTAKRWRIHKTSWVWRERAVVNCCHHEFDFTWIINKLM